MTGVLALLAVAAVVALLARVKARLAPPPVYDWPVWAYRVAFATRAALRRWRVSASVPR